MKPNTEKFEKQLRELNIELTENQIDQFIKYYEILIEWNNVMNLTAITEYDEVITKHFIDSLSLKKIIDLDGDLKIIDIGTGAGFPGIPLKIAFPNLNITLLDSLNKRVNFLNEVIDKLGLKNIEALHGRAEEYASPQKLREQYDICVSRAVANLSTLSEYCLPYVKVGGYFISYKSEKLKEELAAGQKAINVLGGKIEKQEEFNLPDSDISRTLLVIKKIGNTPKKFPRKSGTPAKEPIS